MKSEEEIWIRVRHPKLMSKTARVWFYGQLPLTDGRYQAYYATIKFHDLARQVVVTHKKEFFSDVILESILKIETAYAQKHQA